MMDTTRLAELAERLIGPGPKASGVSASECHEIHDDVMELVTEHRAYAALLTDLIEWMRPFEDAGDARLLAPGGHETQLLPTFTRIGTKLRSEALSRAKAALL